MVRMADVRPTAKRNRLVLLGLVGIDLILFGLATSAILRVIANDGARVAGTLAWISVGVLPLLLIALVVLLVRATRGPGLTTL